MILNNELKNCFNLLTEDIEKNLGYSKDEILIELMPTIGEEANIQFLIYGNDILLRSWMLGETHIMCYYEDSMVGYLTHLERLQLYQAFKDLKKPMIICLEN